KMAEVTLRAGWPRPIHLIKLYRPTATPIRENTTMAFCLASSGSSGLLPAGRNLLKKMLTNCDITNPNTTQVDSVVTGRFVRVLSQTSSGALLKLHPVSL